MGSSRFRDWVEKVLPWYHPHAERLRNVKSEVLARMTADTLEEAQRVIRSRQHVIDDYEDAERQRVGKP